MSDVEMMLQEIEGEEDLQSIKEKMAIVERRIRPQVTDEVWDQFLAWESLWGEYVTFHVHSLFEKFNDHRQTYNRKEMKYGSDK